MRPEQVTTADLEGQQVLAASSWLLSTTYYFCGGGQVCVVSWDVSADLCSLGLFSGVSADGWAVLRHQSVALAFSVLLVLPHCFSPSAPTQRHHPAQFCHTLHDGSRVSGEKSSLHSLSSTFSPFCGHYVWKQIQYSAISIQILQQKYRVLVKN